MPNPLTEPYLLDALARGIVVVLPNRRAARTLRQAFNERQRADGLRAWDAPGAVAWADWTRGLWSGLAVEGHELRVRLNAAQEHQLWREIVEASVAARTLSAPDALAKMASSAWSLAAAYRATGRIRATATTFDTRTFAAWTESFRKFCASESWVASAEVEEVLCAHAGSGVLRLDGPVLVAGSEELAPAQSALIDALQASGAQITEAALESSETSTSSRVATVLPTPRDEMVFAAWWLQELFADRAFDSKPPRIAVIVPQPEECRAELESVFRQILAPELQPIEADNSAAPWEFSAGTPLFAQPMISDALAALRLAQGPLPIERLGALLRSPFIGVSSERMAAARFDANVLRRAPYLLPELDMVGLTRLIRQQSDSGKSSTFVSTWLKAFDDVRVARLRTSGSRSYAEWSEVIRDLLRAANWPGDRAPTPFEFSTASAWDATLDLLATLDFRGQRASFASAVKTFEQLLQSARVSPLATGAPVQIMRPEEAEGGVFDAVVLLHATDQAWPEAANLSPLLGWPLQQELRLPGANAPRDADRATMHAESLLRRTSKLLVLSAAADERGPLRQSPLLKRLNIPTVPPEDLVRPVTSAPVVAEEVQTDDVTLPSLPSPDLRGGASVLRQQAACGFLAFAEMRLHSTTVDPCELGLDAIERGNLVHRALESFWSVTRSQEELRSLSIEERHRRLSNAIDTAFSRLSAPSPGWGAAYIGLQRERLRRLLLRWIDVELQRGPFTVRQREERTAIPIGPLRLKVQPDRIDEVEGGVVLVDYKTGHRAHSSNWLGNRPDDPQLPLYALLTKEDELQALLFGRVRPGSEMKWQGLAANQSILPGQKRQVIVDLELRRSDWNTVLTTLAEDFAAGRADVNPKSIALNCNGCPQRLLCRIDPAAFTDSAGDDAESEEESDV
jgi:ATP-dependent helicase/nuclease subunit B